VKETIDAIGDLFGRTWRAIRFRKNDQLERDLDTAMKGIDFMAALRERQEQGVVDDETARKLACPHRNTSRIFSARASC
jgi:hypothetical protein